jgi:hypothetical protein
MDANRQLPIGVRHKSSPRLLLENELKVNESDQLGHVLICKGVPPWAPFLE